MKYRFRAKVAAEWTELNGWVWYYDIIDQSWPIGNQVRITGIRRSQQECIHDACDLLWDFYACPPLH